VQRLQCRACTGAVLHPGDTGSSPQAQLAQGAACLVPAVLGQMRREEELRQRLRELHESQAARESSRGAAAELEALRREERTLQRKMHDLQHSLVRAPPLRSPLPTRNRTRPTLRSLQAQHPMCKGSRHECLVQCMVPLATVYSAVCNSAYVWRLCGQTGGV